jgi:hypothetical protein
MSGGHFDYRQSAMGYIADRIEQDIALALQPKPEKVKERYWSIYEQTSLHSYRPFCICQNFDTYEQAESFLLMDKSVVKAEDCFVDKCLCEDDDVVFQSNKRVMSGVKGEKQIPVLYWIHYCNYEHYPYDADVLELDETSLEIMKEAYKQIRLAEIYATRVDWMMSGDDSEETMVERLKEDLNNFYGELDGKDWGYIENEEENN